MRHTGFSLWLALGLVFGAFVTDAAAQGGGGGFWEKMSGPGRWAYGYGYYSICLKCDKSDKNKVQTLTGNRLWLNLGGSFASTGDENRPGELVSPDLRALSFEPSVDLKVWSCHEGAPALLLGVGAGVHRFWGEDVGFWRGSVEARVTGVIARRHGVNYGVRWSAKLFPEGFTAADFGDPAGTYSTNGGDWVYSITLFFHAN